MARDGKRRRLGTAGALATGVVVGIAARKALRRLDLETVARKLEKRLAQ